MSRPLLPEKKARFLDSALRLFVANGVAHTSTAEIARAAGTAAGTLFVYFPTKQDLIDELVLKISREQAASIRERLSPELSARQSFLAIWEGSLCWFLENRDAYRYIQQIRDSGMITAAVEQETGKSLEYYYVAIQKGLQEGSIRPYPLELIGEILYQDIVAVMQVIQRQSDPARGEEVMRMGFDIFWEGIRA